jgi:hypothetical protein
MTDHIFRTADRRICGWATLEREIPRSKVAGRWRSYHPKIDEFAAPNGKNMSRLHVAAL